MARLQEHSLLTSALELKYERSCHLVDIIAKDEDMRRLRFDVHVLEDDNDELRELLVQEGDRSDTFEKLVNENLARAEGAETRMHDIEAELRVRDQQVGSLEAEMRALQTTAKDSEAFLTEKLALTRELSVLRPELEHLKAQTAGTEALMLEKLELQRQLSSIQCELENAKRDTKRALAKRRNTGVEIAQEEQMEDLKRQLAKEKRARQRAEEAAETTQDSIHIDEVRKELAREKRARQKAEDELEAAHENARVEDVRKDLLKEKKVRAKLEDTIENLREELKKEKRAAAHAGERLDGTIDSDEHVEELRRELANENRERTRVEMAAQRAAVEFEAQKATLDDKIEQLRTKLRSTKEKLRQTEAELEISRADPLPAPSRPAKKTANAAALSAQNTRKRNAIQSDADATTLGTPGDGPIAKRSRKAAGAVGEKSTFSITPFLNRTMSIAPESPGGHSEDGQHADDPVESIESPTTGQASVRRKARPLAPMSSSDVNIQEIPAPRPRKQKPTAPVLEMVTEEVEDIHGQGQENTSKQQAVRVKIKTSDGPGTERMTEGNKRKKVRKSLVDFASFSVEPDVKKREKKSRKLGGIGKTLFDEDDVAAAPTAAPGRTLLVARGFGALGAGVKKSGGLIGAGKVGSSILMTAADGGGFQFSPLKRRKGNLDDTLRC